MLLIIAFAAFSATVLGGLFALRLKDRLHLILGFSAGAVVGVAFFDLLPEALLLGRPFFSAPTIISVAALGFALYLMLDRLFLLHSCEEEREEKSGVHQAQNKRRGALGAGSLSLHSFLDGLGIGLAFKVSPAVGLIVAFAVLTHDFSDGINTVSFILKNQGERRQAVRWLLIDALAPVLGVITTFFFTVPQQKLSLLLALFGGFFLYLGASDLLPESHHTHPKRWTTFMTVLGMGVLYLIIRLAGV